MNSRYLESNIEHDLIDKMVFLSGPRQVGKTTLSWNLLKPRKLSAEDPAYMNWDSPGVAKRLLGGYLPPDKRLLVLDEIHKYPRWRNLIKGLYDTHKNSKQFLVTGSARLDLFRKGGDSLQGRYFHYRLHPYSINEFSKKSTLPDVEYLLKFGGFPEPLFKAEEIFWKRWQKDRLTRVIREDLRDLHRIREITLVELLAEALPTRVGSPLSVKNLREELQVDHSTAENWIKSLESLYYCFRIPPYGSPKIRAVKKEQKLYMWDWSLVEDPGARFENLIASQLLKYCHFKEDTLGDKMELRYIRDTDKREVDFVVICNKKVEFAVEAKSGSKNIAPSIKYFKDRTPIAKWFQVHLANDSWEKDGVVCLPFHDFAKLMKLP